MASQDRSFRGEAANGELDAMPVIECGLTDDVGVGLVANTPTEIGRPFDGEVPVMLAVCEVEGKDRFHRVHHNFTLSKANFALVSGVLNRRFVGWRASEVRYPIDA